MLATAYINANPSLIAGAVLAEPGGFVYEDVLAYTKRVRKKSLFSELSNDALYADQFFTVKNNEHEVLDYKLALLTAYANAPGNEIGNAGQYPFWRSGAIVEAALFEIADRDGFDWTKNLGQYPVKVLFAYSELSRAYGLEYAQKVSSAYPQVQLEKISGTGHEIFYFGWENIHPLIVNYLNPLK
jgi:proline iminopeptidase